MAKDTDKNVKTDSESIALTKSKSKTGASIGSVYSAGELAAAAQKTFGVLPEIVLAAFKYADKDRATIAEAKKIVNSFLSKEII